MNNRLILKTVTISAIVIICALVAYGVFNDNGSGVSAVRDFTRIVDQNKLGNSNAFSSQQTPLTRAADVQLAKQIIDNNLKQKSAIAGKNSRAINQKLNETQVLIDKFNYEAAYSKVSEAVTLSNDSIRDYLSNNNNAITEINKVSGAAILSKASVKDYKSLNHYINGDWACVSVVSQPDGNTALVILKKVNNQWLVVSGPGTNYDGQVLSELGVPSDVAAAMLSNFSDMDYLTQIKI